MNNRRDPNLAKFDELLLGRPIDELVELEPGISARRRIKPAPKPAPSQFVIEQGTGYVEKYVKEEQEKILEHATMAEEFQKARIQGPGMSMLEDDSTICEELRSALDDDILKQKAMCFEEFDFTTVIEKPPLAIDSKKEEIIQLLKKENAIIIRGFTGCGKTTQVPQFILDECYQSKTPCNIVVTQPRRIAAISVAQRVCQERNWALGTVVGYAIGMERKVNSYTCLTYMTTGCLLESLVAKKSLDGFTHILVDEVHERDEDTDLLLMIIKKFLFHTRSNVKVILMSATADSCKFSRYFAKPINGILHNAQVVSVDSIETHPVRVYHLDDLQNLPFLATCVPKRDDSASPQIEESTYELATRLIAALDEKREIMRFGRYSEEYRNISSTRGAVLVFLPGLYEIESMHKALVQYEDTCDNDKKNYWLILPLHSRVSGEEQSRVFQKPPQHMRHYRKIILSTNIAESSLTVPDILYVVDFCLVKQLVTDAETNFCTLKMDWASKSSCIQRKGRVGRVNEGVVYRMVYREFFDRVMPDDIPPEILRCPLEHTVLRVKLLDLGAPKALLALLVDPPDCENIVRTIFTLKEVGALFVTAEGKLTIEDGDLSYLGRIAARLPIEVHLGKLIMLGYIFNVLEESIIMAAGLASKNIFTSSYQKKLFAYKVRMMWDQGAFSDPIAILNAYQYWKILVHNEEFKRPGESEYAREKRWAYENYIELKALKEMDILVNELRLRLGQMGIESVGGPNVKPLSNNQKALLFRVIIHGAFYPNYFSRDTLSGKVDERDAVRNVGGLCPYKTVRLQGFPPEHPPKAYIMQIKEYLRDIFAMLREETWNATIKFDSARVLIQFHQEGNPVQTTRVSRICLPVYLAVKQSQLGIRYTLQLMDRNTAEAYSRKVEETGKRLLGLSDSASVASSSYSSRTDVPCEFHIPSARIPEMNEIYLDVSVCHVEDANRFWCHRLEKSTRSDYQHINKIIGERGKKLKPVDPSNFPIRKGSIVVAPFVLEDGSKEYYRAKVLSVQRSGPEKERKVKLYFIDFGNADEVYIKDLMAVPDELLAFAPLSIECRLVGVGPNLMHDPVGRWNEHAKVWFERQTRDKELKAKVYSVVDGVTVMDLIPAEGGDWDNSLARQLIELNYAVKIEEPYISKMDNEERRNVLESKSKHAEAYKMRERELARTTAAELMAIENEVPEIPGLRPQIRGKINLKGPYSSLEMRMYSKMHSLLGYTVSSEGDSVNSVLLDENPSDCHERLLIAAQVGAPNSRTLKVTARNTTLLPSIPGLPAKLTLIFAPRAEFRCDKQRKRLTGAICGLGYDRQTSHSLYQAHDMEIVFDTEISLKDVLLINKIRYWMNTVLGAQTYSAQHAAPSVERMREVSYKVIHLLTDLLSKTPSDVEPQPSNTYEWNKVPNDHILRSDIPESQYDSLIPLLDCIKLIP